MHPIFSHPSFCQMDPLKQELLKYAYTQAEGKTGQSLATVMMTVLLTAQKKNIHFTPEESSLLLELIKQNKTEQEKQQVDAMIRVLSGYLKQHTQKKEG